MVSTNVLGPGSIIGERYRIIGILGEGGCATVYRAAQLNLANREVAIKVLKPMQAVDALERAAERFLKEAMTAAKIRHPNVVTVHDVGLIGPARPYIVMQAVRGHSLTEELRRFGPLAPDRALPLVVACLGALAEAHAAGIVHRDLKPGNLMLTDPGSDVEALRIIDFGIAILQSAQNRVTAANIRLGTPRYMAPEYIAHAEVSPELDVYQMGILLTEILTGQFAVDADDRVAQVALILTGDLNLPVALHRSPLGPVLLRATSLDAAERYRNAAEMRAALLTVDPSSIPVTGTYPPRVEPEPAPLQKPRAWEIPIFDSNTAQVAKPAPKEDPAQEWATAPTLVLGPDQTEKIDNP